MDLHEEIDICKSESLSFIEVIQLVSTHTHTQLTAAWLVHC